MIKQTLSQKMLQKLSPQQIQLMKLFQIPTANLEERIQEELEINPALEEGGESADVFDIESDEWGSHKEEDSEKSNNDEDFELGDYLNEYLDDDPSLYKMKGDEYLNAEERKMPVPVENTFHESLERQIGMLNVYDDEVVILKQIIGSIDDDGYLRRESDSIVDDLLFAHNIETDIQTVDRLIKIVQKFEPAGIGARTLQECLILQLDDKIEKDPSFNNEERKLAMKILNEYFDEFTKKHYLKLKKVLNISDSELKEAIDEILRLNPKPAGIIEGNNMQNNYILPDFIIYNRDGELELVLNSKNAPDLRINDQYMDMLKGYRESVSGRRATRSEKEAVLFIKQKIDSAKWFIDAIKQRQDTLYRTMYAIMQYQYDYFSTGDERRIKPMILKDLADVTGLDISTVSRVANSKFVQTEFGTKLLKEFFSESMQAQDGTEVSTLEVKTILGDEIAREDKRKPLSDEKLMEILLDKGYNIARRTIAKYREQLNIPVARLRKEL
ncbi:MAG TPA: RNA polymerase factor sigma-54 [Saprospiraceae bacterium]|jgi:RNA polymerase sigma-54 factor|nr:RNA polymerase factor sigma-54 [Saprospiraceae bacterium]HRO08240.1 RNA polymerase factor sigma-54 [Saprospiraceae bacterium]HRP41131.1 RNA polymerase factor sigma-54 [Saprospiraceae bacterium]